VQRILIKNISELVTCSGFRAKAGPEEMGSLGIIEEGAVAIEGGLITAVGPNAAVCQERGEERFDTVIDARGRAVLPGFVDPHTHLVFAGYRPDEFAWRLAGEDYLDILKRGGGILRTVADTRAASGASLVASGMERLDLFLSQGVTTLEAKSGYGLDLETEIRQLEAMAALNGAHPVEVVPTFLGAHAVPAEFRSRPDDYMAFVINDVLPKVAERRLAEYCDVFCEAHVFSVAQSRRLLERARDLGLGLKLHADEMNPLGGAELAAQLGAVSADHLLRASDRGIDRMAEAGVTAVLLPGTAFCLRQPYARARHIIDRGCAVALATDFNPGSSFAASIPLIIALATLHMGMSPEETITALTLNGAAALGRADRIGSIDVGKRGNLIILAFPSYRYLPYHTATNCVETVIKDGWVVWDRRRYHAVAREGAAP
jgi:imidazolonepropionase